jgi:hypothetical protein
MNNDTEKISYKVKLKGDDEPEDNKNFVNREEEIFFRNESPR